MRRGRGFADEPGANDKKSFFIFDAAEPAALQERSWAMSEAFGLDRRIETYRGKRSIGLYRWDVEVLVAVVESALQDAVLPDRMVLTGLLQRLPAALEA